MRQRRKGNEDVQGGGIRVCLCACHLEGRPLIAARSATAGVALPGLPCLLLLKPAAPLRNPRLPCLSQGSRVALSWNQAKERPMAMRGSRTRSPRRLLPKPAGAGSRPSPGKWGKRNHPGPGPGEAFLDPVISFGPGLDPLVLAFPPGGLGHPLWEKGRRPRGLPLPKCGQLKRQQDVRIAKAHETNLEALHEPKTLARSVFGEGKLEPATGFEPVTCGLRNRCSTTELRWRAGRVWGGNYHKGPRALQLLSRTTATFARGASRFTGPGQSCLPRREP
jgi:hypothetical protein